MNMRTFKNKKLIKITIIIVVFVAVVVGVWDWKLSQNTFKNNGENVIPDTEILGNVGDLVSFSVEPGDSVSGVLAVTGSVQGGYFFEANIQVNILDSGMKILKKGNGNAKTEWMTSGPVGFDAIIDFTKLPKGRAYIEIHNDNASGLPENDKSILVPIVIQ